MTPFEQHVAKIMARPGMALVNPEKAKRIALRELGLRWDDYLQMWLQPGALYRRLVPVGVVIKAGITGGLIQPACGGNPLVFLPKGLDGDPERLRRVYEGQMVTFKRDGDGRHACKVRIRQGDHWVPPFAVFETGIVHANNTIVPDANHDETITFGRIDAKVAPGDKVQFVRRGGPGSTSAAFVEVLAPTVEEIIASAPVVVYRRRRSADSVLRSANA
jgi:hypothetical protein